jgi:hypothetical protein
MVEEKRHKKKAASLQKPSSASQSDSGSTRYSSALITVVLCFLSVLGILSTAYSISTAPIELFSTSLDASSNTSDRIEEVLKQRQRGNLILRLTGGEHKLFAEQFLSLIATRPWLSVFPAELSATTESQVQSILSKHQAMLPSSLWINLSTAKEPLKALSEAVANRSLTIGEPNDPLSLKEAFWGENKQKFESLVQRSEPSAGQVQVITLLIDPKRMIERGANSVVAEIHEILTECRAAHPTVEAAWVSPVREELDSLHRVRQYVPTYVALSLLAGLLGIYVALPSLSISIVPICALVTGVFIAAIGSLNLGAGALQTIQLAVPLSASIALMCIFFRLTCCKKDAVNSSEKQSYVWGILCLAILSLVAIPFVDREQPFFQSFGLQLLCCSVAIGIIVLGFEINSSPKALALERVADRSRAIQLALSRISVKRLYLFSILLIGLISACIHFTFQRLTSIQTSNALSEETIRDKARVFHGKEKGLPEGYIYYFADNEGIAIDASKVLAPTVKTMINKGWIGDAITFAEVFPSIASQRQMQRFIRTILKVERPQLGKIFSLYGKTQEGLESLYASIKEQSSDLLLPNDFRQTSLVAFFDELIFEHGNGVVVVVPLYELTSPQSVRDQLPQGYHFFSNKGGSENLPSLSVHRCLPLIVFFLAGTLLAFSTKTHWTYSSLAVLVTTLIGAIAGIGITQMPPTGFALGAACLLPIATFISNHNLRNGVVVHVIVGVILTIGFSTLPLVCNPQKAVATFALAMVWGAVVSAIALLAACGILLGRKQLAD